MKTLCGSLWKSVNLTIFMGTTEPDFSVDLMSYKNGSCQMDNKGGGSLDGPAQSA